MVIRFKRSFCKGTATAYTLARSTETVIAVIFEPLNFMHSDSMV